MELATDNHASLLEDNPLGSFHLVLNF